MSEREAEAKGLPRTLEEIEELMKKEGIIQVLKKNGVY
jgi:hypothetical protein